MGGYFTWQTLLLTGCSSALPASSSGLQYLNNTIFN